MSFPGALDGAFLAALQSLDGSDPATLRLTSLGIGTASFFLEEEQSQDAEVNHTTEVVGWIALDGTGLIACAKRKLPSPAASPSQRHRISSLCRSLHRTNLL